MKRTFFIILCLQLAQAGLAQFTTTLVVLPQPPGTLIDWGTRELTYVISGQPGLPPRQAIIRAELKASDGSIAASTNLAKARVRPVGNGTLILYSPDVIPVDIMIFNGRFKKSIERSGKLPADNYTLCVRLVTPVDFFPLSTDQCRSFSIAAFQLPIPTMPFKDEVLDAEKAQTAIIFRWTPVSPRPGELVKYIVTVFQILDRQTPMQALRSNRPLLAKEVVAGTQFIWQPQLSFIDTIRFIWTIQTLDSRGIPFGDGNVNADGISEPCVFTVRRRPKPN